MTARVLAVHASPDHAFSKARRAAITLIAGHGVAGDAHGGVTMQHRSRVARDPRQPNLRQVHLIHAELLEELAGRGFAVAPQVVEGFEHRVEERCAIARPWRRRVRPEGGMPP